MIKNKSINTITAFFFFYSIGISSITTPTVLKEQALIQKNTKRENNHKSSFNCSSLLHQNSLTEKIYLDMYFSKSIDFTQKSYVTQISINKEGKVLGYKPTQLRLITYSLEKQMINLVNKNVSMIKDTSSVYWLSLTNKH